MFFHDASQMFNVLLKLGRRTNPGNIKIGDQVRFAKNKVIPYRPKYQVDTLQPGYMKPYRVPCLEFCVDELYPLLEPIDKAVQKPMKPYKLEFPGDKKSTNKTKAK